MFFVRIIIIVGIWFQVTFTKTPINQIHSICSSVKTYFGFCSPNNNESVLRLAFKKMADSSFSCSHRFNTLRRRSGFSHVAFWQQSVKYKHIFWSKTFFYWKLADQRFKHQIFSWESLIDRKCAFNIIYSVVRPAQGSRATRYKVLRSKRHSWCEYMRKIMWIVNMNRLRFCWSGRSLSNWPFISPLK